MDSATFKLIMVIGLVSWILNTFLDRSWPATKAFFAALSKVFVAGLPPWIPGFALGEELRRSRQRLRSTVQAGFRELLRPTRDFLVLVVLAVLLYAAVKAAAAPDAKDHIVWVVPPDGSEECERDGTSCPSGDECFTPIECSLATRGIEDGMEFVSAYPRRRQLPVAGQKVHPEGIEFPAERLELKKRIHADHDGERVAGRDRIGIPETAWRRQPRMRPETKPRVTVSRQHRLLAVRVDRAGVDERRQPCAIIHDDLEVRLTGTW